MPQLVNTRIVPQAIYRWVFLCRSYALWLQAWQMCRGVTGLYCL